MRSRYLRRSFSLALVMAAALGSPAVCRAHFGVLIPSDDIVEGADPKEVAVSLQFMHPFEQTFMEMAQPLDFGVVVRGTRTSLMASLMKQSGTGHTTWLGSAPFNRPGDYIFYFIPAPYWEQAEDKYIQHYTKTVVNGFGLEEGWDEPIGLATEIVPLTRPYGLWTGNLFCGRIIAEGKPVPGGEVEIEFYNERKAVKTPAGPYVTQTLHADGEGIFCYAMPRAGWWGFAALNEAEKKMDHKGRMVPVELGAVIWVHVRDMR